MKTALTCAAASAMLSLTSGLHAQICYDNPSQCFSFAPWPKQKEKLDTGLNLRSEKFELTGDIRLRVRMSSKPSDKAYPDGNQQATRARIQGKYQVNDNVYAYSEVNFSEVWAGSDPYSDARTSANFNGISQFYIDADNLFGVNDDWRIGRSFFQLGNSLVLGSCDFLQYPATFTGVWAAMEIEGHHIELFGFDDYGPLQSVNAGTRYWGASGRLNFGTEKEQDYVHYVNAYFLAGTEDGFVDATDCWAGLEAQGSAPADIKWRAEFGHRFTDMGGDVSAYRIRIDKGLNLFNGVVDGVSFVRTDSEGRMHINPGDFNTAGILHQYGGAWRSNLETNQLGISLKPGHDLNLGFNFLTLHRNGSFAQQGDFEADVTLGKLLSSGVFAWGGFGIDNEGRQAAYFQVTLQF